MLICIQLQGGSGSVQGVMFANIQVSEVQHPIIIDQFYCDGGKCSNHTSAVGISAVSFQNITGTYTKSPVHFACSDTMPCTGVTLTTIELTAKQETEPFCWQTYGKLQTETIPPVNCLKAGNKSKYDRCWSEIPVKGRVGKKATAFTGSHFSYHI